MKPVRRAQRYKHLAELAWFRRRYDWDRVAAPRDGELVLFYNRMWGRPPSLPPGGLPPGCEITTDVRRFREATAVVFHVPSLGSLGGVRKYPGQLWVAQSLESGEHYPRLRDPAFMGRFDLTMGFWRTADVVMPAWRPEPAEALRTPPREKTATAPVVAFLSSRHDRSGRVAYLRELMRHVDVHSFGRQLRNRRLRGDRGPASKRAAIARYKFTLAFENAIERDYVTEKLYEPLAAGSVPVYLGAPNVDELAPGDGCLLDVRDFGGPRELAARLRELDRDEDAYAELHAWRERPLRPSFLARLDGWRTPPLLRLFERLAEFRAPGGR